MRATIFTGAGTIAVLSLAAAIVRLLGQKMTAWKEPKQREINVSDDQGHVTLQADAWTSAPGVYGIVLHGTHIKVGEVTSRDDGKGEVTREIQAWSGAPLSGHVRGAWTGQAFASPGDLGLDYEEINIDSSGSRLPAWIFRPQGERTNTWAIHIHGLRSSRASMLRSVPSAARLGMTSLVPSFFGDAENHSDGQVCHYGSLEAYDVDRALTYAVEHGADAIYLFGWSMGATIALSLTENSKHRELIAGLVLVSPGPNTRAVLETNVRTAGVPARLASLVPNILSNPALRRLTALRYPINFDNLDWTRTEGRLKVPALVIHSQGDTEVPYALSTKFSQVNSSLVTLKEFHKVPHQYEWNSNPSKFEDEVSSWVREAVRLRASGNDRKA